MAQKLNPNIIADIKRVAERLCLRVGDEFGRQQYLGHPDHQFTKDDIYDGGNGWKAYCPAAGFTTKEIGQVSDDDYYQRLQEAMRQIFDEEGKERYPKSYEKKRFGLNFPKKRWGTLEKFIKQAVALGQIKDLRPKPVKLARTEVSVTIPTVLPSPPIAEEARPIPAIPSKTRRQKWQRTNVKGLPYAPHDELSVVALFGILCATSRLGDRNWEILEMTGGKGIDAICWDHDAKQEIRVELKHTFSKNNWNHLVEEIDYVVCWENRWKDFEKPVIELRGILK